MKYNVENSRKKSHLLSFGDYRISQNLDVRAKRGEVFRKLETPLRNLISTSFSFETSLKYLTSLRVKINIKSEII